MNTHQEVLELLPWFVNGTLNERDQSKVNEHLEGCGECDHEVQVLMETSKVFHATTEPSAESIGRARSEFLQRLEVSAERKTYRATRRWMIPATMAACLLIAALFFGPMLQQQESFRTLSNTVPGNGPVIQLVFQPDTPEKSIRDLVLGNQGHIINGPTPQGVYRLELPADSDPHRVLKRLQDHTDVKFAALEANP
jgi:anti-sigma factor RsiW